MAVAVSTHLDGDALSQALVSGIHRVIGDQDFLNKINVFPVADGDTGTNLSLSLGAALGVLKQPGDKHLGTLLTATADALLDGSRGNSGAIMAQFFQGISDSAGELTRFTAATFGKAVSMGSDYAHDALSNPEEGTILSVIAAFAGALQTATAGDQQREFGEVFEEVMPKLDQALENTTGQLEVLRKAGVVDAGAKGFVDLVKGMGDYLVHGTITKKPDMTVLESVEFTDMRTESDDAYAYRFCTECIVTGSDINRRKLREALARLGASLVLAGSKRKAKIHIHVNEPQAVFDVARRFGEISGEKADDLQRQQHRGLEQAAEFAVITDSAADIPDSDMERLDIHMVPCRIQFGDRGYLDKLSITTEEFYEQLANNPHHPTTSQPAPGDYRRQFQYLASHFSDVLSINLTAEASGTYEAARSAAGRSDAPGQVHVINSRNASVGQGLLVVFAAECAQAGLSARATIEAVESLIPATHTYGVLKNLDYAVRGGRIPKWVKFIAESIRMTPVIRTSAAGKIELTTCLFGRHNVARRFAKHVAKKIRGDRPMLLAVGHAVAADQLAEIDAVLEASVPNIKRLTHMELGTALGVHGGPGTLVIGTQPYLNPADLQD